MGLEDRWRAGITGVGGACAPAKGLVGGFMVWFVREGGVGGRGMECACGPCARTIEK